MAAEQVAWRNCGAPTPQFLHATRTHPPAVATDAAERRFRAMGSDAHLIVVGGPIGLIDMAHDRVDELERRWSRFLDDSEISLLNRSAGTFVDVSHDTILLIERAVEAWSLTGGAFDPTVLGAMIRAGYDRSFETLGPTPPPGHSVLGVGAESIAIAGNQVCVPPRIGFDPGGIGKGLAADLVCAEVMAAGADGVCVNLGGDVRVTGIGPGGGPWTVAIEHPGSLQPIAMIGLHDGAVATSTTLRRRWQTNGETRHHLIDPRTGLPSDSDLVLAAVVAGDAWMAEVLAKAVLLAGARYSFDTIGGTAAQALAVDVGGRITATPKIADYLGGIPLPNAVNAHLIDIERTSDS